MSSTSDTLMQPEENWASDESNPPPYGVKAFLANFQTNHG